LKRKVLRTNIKVLLNHLSKTAITIAFVLAKFGTPAMVGQNQLTRVAYGTKREFRRFIAENLMDSDFAKGNQLC